MILIKSLLSSVFVLNLVSASAASTFNSLLETSINLARSVSGYPSSSLPAITNSTPEAEVDLNEATQLHFFENEDNNDFVFIENFFKNENDDSNSLVLIKNNYSNDPNAQLFNILTSDIIVYLTTFMINEESANLHLLHLVRKVPRLYHILFHLSSLKDFPIPLINCFGFFSPQEIFFLHQITPEICHAHQNGRLEQFLWTKRFIFPNFYDNFLIQILDKNKYFQQVLKNMENRSCSWETRVQFVQKYHSSCLVSNYVSFYFIRPVPSSIVAEQHDQFVHLISKYYLDENFISLALKNFNVKTRSFLTGCMLTVPGQYNSVLKSLENVRKHSGEHENFFKGFLSANSGPFSDEEAEEIKNRNIALINSIDFLKSKIIFTLANLLKFGSASDIDTINPMDYFIFLSEWNEYIFLIVWRRPQLSEAWRRLYERLHVKNSYTTALFAPEAFINSLNLSVDPVAQAIMSIKSKLPPTPASRSFIENFRKSVHCHIKEHSWISTDSEHLLPYFIYSDLFKDCLMKNDKSSLKPLVETILKFSNCMKRSDILKHSTFHHEYLKKNLPNSEQTYETLFLYSIFINDQIAFKIVRDSFQYDSDGEKFKFYSAFLEWRRVPVAYMKRFLMAWTGASESDLQVVFSRKNRYPRSYDNNAQTYLSVIISSLSMQVVEGIRSKKESCSPILTHEIRNTDFWYFYLAYNEESFREVCASFEKYFRPLPNLILY